MATSNNLLFIASRRAAGAENPQLMQVSSLPGLESPQLVQDQVPAEVIPCAVAATGAQRVGYSTVRKKAPRTSATCTWIYGNRSSRRISGFTGIGEAEE